MVKTFATVALLTHFPHLSIHGPLAEAIIGTTADGSQQGLLKLGQQFPAKDRKYCSILDIMRECTICAYPSKKPRGQSNPVLLLDCIVNNIRVDETDHATTSC